MQSAWQSIKNKRQNESFRKWIDVALIALKKGQSIRVPTKVSTYILLNNPTIDDKYSTQVRNIGAGVKELYIKEI